MDCKYQHATDITPWRGGVFDHPDYEYTCSLSGKIVHPCFRCTPDKCKNYEPTMSVGGVNQDDS